MPAWRNAGETLRDGRPDGHMMDEQQRMIIDWVQADPYRMQALDQAAALGLNDWCLAAGFLRNLVWDRLHDYPVPTPLNDLDLIYFDPAGDSVERDRSLERRLRARTSWPWSVKNQARMHLRNGDAAYTDTMDAMSYWPEVETAIGVRIDPSGGLELLTPFGLEALFAMTITMNPRRSGPEIFRKRVISKGWLQHWPRLHVVDAAALRYPLSGQAGG